jgi:hypothetical protein
MATPHQRSKKSVKKRYTCKVCGKKMNGPSSHKALHKDDPASTPVGEDVATLVIEGLEAIKGQVKAQAKKDAQLKKILEQALAVLDG